MKYLQIIPRHLPNQIHIEKWAPSDRPHQPIWWPIRNIRKILFLQRTEGREKDYEGEALRGHQQFQQNSWLVLTDSLTGECTRELNEPPLIKQLLLQIKFPLKCLLPLRSSTDLFLKLLLWFSHKVSLGSPSY